jgi:hypothetical protein
VKDSRWMRFFADSLMVLGNSDCIAKRFGARHCDSDFVKIIPLCLFKLECEQIVDFGE